jgi:Spy/CpxP family protein refolding chaperone
MEPQAGHPMKWRGQGNEDFGGDGEGRMPPGMERAGGGNRGGHSRQFGGGGRMPGMGPLDLSVLNLSEEQKTKIRTLRESSASRGKELMQNLKQSRLQMRDMMFDPEVSEKTLRSRHAQLKKQEEELGSLMIDDFLSIRSVLTPEQMKHLPELKPQGRGPNAARGGGVNRNSAP